jgi:hypothetical protein
MIFDTELANKEIEKLNKQIEDLEIMRKGEIDRLNESFKMLLDDYKNMHESDMKEIERLQQELNELKSNA